MSQRFTATHPESFRDQAARANTKAKACRQRVSVPTHGKQKRSAKMKEKQREK